MEIPWQILCGTIAFFCWYYPVGLYKNAEPTDSVAERGALMWIIIVLFLFFVQPWDSCACHLMSWPIMQRI